MVPVSTFITIVFGLLCGVAIPLALILVIRRKFHLALRPFWIGCAVWVLFAMVLERIMHTFVLKSPIGAAVQTNMWWLALYGGLAAGIFEETGRFLAMRHVLKKEWSDDRNALVYGAGHGGCEAAAILLIGMANNLIYSILINQNMTGILTGAVSGDQVAAVQNLFDTLITTPSATFLVSPVERLSAVILHIALSVIVWFAVTRNRIWLFPVAIAIHAVVDGVAVILSKSGMGMWWVELVVFAMVVATVALACFLWKKYAATASATKTATATAMETDTAASTETAAAVATTTDADANITTDADANITTDADVID